MDLLIPTASLGKDSVEDMEIHSEDTLDGDLASDPLQQPRNSNGSSAVQTIRSLEGIFDDGLKVGMQQQEEVSAAIFKDRRWEFGITHLRDTGVLSDQSLLLAYLRKGAEDFGLWFVPDDGLMTLAQHLRGDEEPAPSASVASWVALLQTRVGSPMSAMESRTVKRISTVFTPAEAETRSSAWSVATSVDVLRLKAAVLFFAVVVAITYSVLFLTFFYPTAWEIFGWQVVMARGTAGAIGVLSALLFLTMARSFLTFCRRYGCLSLRTLLDAHQELHIFCGWLTVVFAVVHSLGHLIGTVPGFITKTTTQLNSVLGCANAATHPWYTHTALGALTFPKCPFTFEYGSYTYLDVLFLTSPGLSGILLWLVLGLMAFTGRRARRSENHDQFWYVHHAGILLWPPLLFWHGAGGWVGFGLPLAVLLLPLPLALSLWDRLKWRCLRYLRRSRSRLESVLIRPGRDGGPDGSLLKLQFSSSWVQRRYNAGMYAFLCMPEYAPLQWHPFTICSGRSESTLDFIIAGVGDWTQALARACQDVRSGIRDSLPEIIVDGPYSAPIQGSLLSEVLIAVGAGVGVTPFLSLLSSVTAELDELDPAGALPLKQAHFFWMTRSFDEFLFGRKYMARIAASPYLRNRIILHLHLTGQAPDKGGTAFLFSEAVRRQSEVDRRAVEEALDSLSGQQRTKVLDNSPQQIPWDWLHGAARANVMWVPGLAHSEPRGASMMCAKTTDSLKEGVGVGRMKAMPVVFGRPDFARAMSKIGKTWPEKNVHIYVCGNKNLVESIRQVTIKCNDKCAKGKQRYTLHYERFG